MHTTLLHIFFGLKMIEKKAQLELIYGHCLSTHLLHLKVIRNMFQ